MMTSNKERVAKWVAALRSGEFRQAARALKNGDGYCCLGVACEVFRRETGTGHWNADDDFVTVDVVEDVDLPGEVADWYGLSSRNPIIGDDDFLSTMGARRSTTSTTPRTT